VLNPYYRHMGGLYGSEYWTYLLPRRVGPEMTAALTSAPFEPVGAQRAVDIGLLDAPVGATAERFRAEVRRVAARLAHDPATPARLADKRRSRARDEQRKPLAAYRAEELARSHECFFGADRSYHEARRRFVYKLGTPCTVAPGPA
jgi:putative two-component system hydrogenase maturation factor HypX/HoxX